ncbi:MAG: hypothetical protein QOJ75_1287 [Chloroflexota bacterium]|jgi:N-acetylglucosamine kinase-like BadF-type ATPase|nr:hypothetical protein [Chloroflexota bacterium]
MSAVYVGVDGGKSKTVCLLADATGTILGWGRSGGSDKAAVPVDEAIDAIATAVDAALAEARVTRNDLAVGCFGLAGADWPEDFILLRDILQERGLARDVVVRNDAQIALRAASRSGLGLVLSAGTHLSVALRTESGQEWFSGWSSVDGPGGSEAGRRVVWAVLHEYDSRGAPTALTGALFEATGLGPEELLRAISRGAVDEQFTAGLAPLLFQTYAATSDAVAAGIIADLGREIARWVTGLSDRFGLMASDLDVFLAGGLFRAPGDLLRESLAAAVRATVPRARLLPAEHEPVVGALYEAFEHAGGALTTGVVHRIAASAPPPAFFETA